MIPNKTSVSHILQEFIILIQNQFKTTIKNIRTDNGTKFFNASVTSFLKNLGIIHQISCAYTPQQNGLAERKHRHLLNCARALRFHVGLPIQYWGDCILTATYMINRTPTAVLNNQSPYQVLYEKVPNYDMIKVFGCLCYATVLPKPGDKFAPRAVKGVFLGYPYAQKGYKVLNLVTKHVIVLRDVHFVGNVFPFKDLPDHPATTLFASSSHCIDDDPFSADRELFVTENEDIILHTDLPSKNVSPSATTKELETDYIHELIQPAPIVRHVRVKKIPAKFAEYTGLPFGFSRSY